LSFSSVDPEHRVARRCDTKKERQFPKNPRVSFCDALQVNDCLILTRGFGLSEVLSEVLENVGQLPHNETGGCFTKEVRPEQRNWAGKPRKAMPHSAEW
jgi:hypothetical protein